MKNKMGLYFQLETGNPKDSLSVVKQALKRLDQLDGEGMDVQYFELRIKKPEELKGSNELFMKLDGEGRTFIENETSKSWNEAFLRAFDKIHHELRQINDLSATVQFA